MCTLKHYGINGMKWGIRRYQNKDGTLTPTGKARYNTNLELHKQKVENAKYQYKRIKHSPLYDRTEKVKAVDNVAFERRRLVDEKIKDKLNSETKKSAHRLKLEQRYLDKGMSQEEAEINAYKRARTEKAIAAVAGLTVAAAAAYVAYRHYDKTVDKVIKSGTELQNINSHGRNGVADAFYAVMTPNDKSKYRGIYAQELFGKGNEKVFSTQIGVTDNIKVASQKHETQALAEYLQSHKDIADSLKKGMSATVPYMANEGDTELAQLFNKAVNDMTKGKVTSKVCDAVNYMLADRKNETIQSVKNGLFDTLKNRGYGAIIDVNDKKYSGYNSQKPLIIFDGGKKTRLNSVIELSRDKVAHDNAVEAAKLNSKQAAKQLISQAVKQLGTPTKAVTAGVLGTVAAKNVAAKKRQKNVIKQYREEHPNSKLSDDDILENYYKH